MLAAMVLTASLCALFGVAPRLLYELLPFPVAWEPYTFGHVMESLQLMAGTALGFAWLQRQLGGEPKVTLDTDRLYRAAGRWVAAALAPAVARAADGLEWWVSRAAEAPVAGPRPRVPISYGVLVAVVVLGLGLMVLAAYNP
jgi:multicomponent Na+:H+ antiporter subunit D